MLNPHVQKRINKLRAEVAMMENIPELRDPQRLEQIKQEFVLLTGLTIASMIDKKPHDLAEKLDAEIEKGGFYVLARKDLESEDENYAVEAHVISMNQDQIINIMLPVMKMTKQEAQSVFSKIPRSKGSSTRKLLAALCLLNLMTLLLVARALTN